MTTSAIYTRISFDKGIAKGEEGLATDRQEKLIRQMLAAKGWSAGKVYCDNSVSATKAQGKRPAYEQMLNDWEAGAFEAIAAYDLDRLYRHPTQLEHLIDLSESRGLMLATVGGDADLSTDNGRLFARIKAAVAKAETERRSERQKAAFAQKRQMGGNFWRGKRPFGLELDGSLRQEEAEALKVCAEKLLNGATLASCVAYMKEQGIKTTFGGEWTVTPLRRTLLHPRIAGMLEHDGELLPGNWEAVLEETTWRSVGSVLADKNRQRFRSTRDTSYLLSGIIECECGRKAYGVKVHTGNGKKNQRHVYRCQVPGDSETHVSKAMAQTDDLVIGHTLALISAPGAQEILTGESVTTSLKDLRESRVAEVARWAEWTEEAAEEGLKPSEYRKPRELHEKRLAEIDAQILEHEKKSLFSDIWASIPALSKEYDTAVRAAWDALPLERRKRIITTVWKSLSIKRTAKGVRWSPEHIVMEHTEAGKRLHLNHLMAALKEVDRHGEIYRKTLETVETPTPAKPE